MTLVNAETGEVVSPEVAEAAERAERIRRGIVALANVRDDVLTAAAEAYRARDWDTLGYDSWESYCAGELGADRIRLDRDQRREIVASLRSEHLSTRAIAAVVGADHSTVVRDLDATGADAPVAETVMSIDGRERPAARPAPRPAPEPEVLDAELVEAEQQNQAIERFVAADPEIGRLRMQAAFSNATKALSGGLLPLDPEAAAHALDEDTTYRAGVLVRDTRDWLTRFERALRGLTVIPGGKQ